MTPDDGDRLKSCAHCGGEAEFGQVPHQPETENSGGVFVECLQCGATTRLVFPCGEDPRPILLEIWNRRAALASAPCRVEPTRRWPDMDPIYLDPPAPDPAGGLSDADIAHRWEADFEWDGPLWSAIKQWEEKGGETRVDAVEREVRRLMREAATPVDPAGDPLVPEREAIPRPLPACHVNRAIRRMLCIAYTGGAAYLDDGEAQDTRAHPFIDFMRDSPGEIQAAMAERALRAAGQPEQGR